MYDLKEICDRLKYLGTQPETPEARVEVEAAFAMKWDGVQCVAAKLLGEWGGRRSVEMLKNWILNNYHREHGYIDGVENIGTHALMKCYEAQDIPWILDVYYNEPKQLWFDNLARSLKGPEVYNRMVAELEHPDPSHRGKAVRAAITLNPIDSCEIFEKMIFDPDPDISNEANIGLGFRCPDSKLHDVFVPGEDEILVIAVTAANEVILILDPSAAFGEEVMILPGGKTEPSEHHVVTANRELQEQAGYTAHRLTFLRELRPWSKYLGMRNWVYLGQDLSASQLMGDEDNVVGVEFVPLADFESWIADGRIKDARVIAALYMARNYLITITDNSKAQ